MHMFLKLPLCICCCILVTPIFGWIKETDVVIEKYYEMKSKTVEEGDPHQHQQFVTISPDDEESEGESEEESEEVDQWTDTHYIKQYNNRQGWSDVFKDLPNQCKLVRPNEDVFQTHISTYAVKFIRYEDNGKEETGACCDSSHIVNLYTCDQECDPQFLIWVSVNGTDTGVSDYGYSGWSENYEPYQDTNGIDFGGSISDLPNPYMICAPFLAPFYLHVSTRDYDAVSSSDPIADLQIQVNPIQDLAYKPEPFAIKEYVLDTGPKGPLYTGPQSRLTLQVRMRSSEKVVTAINSGCAVPGHCWVKWSICDAGVCKCDKEHHYDPLRGVCVSVCDTWGTGWTFFDNWVTNARGNMRSYENVTQHECLTNCDADVLRSAEYEAATGTCLCYVESPGMTTPGTGVVVASPGSGWVLALRRCDTHALVKPIEVPCSEATSLSCGHPKVQPSIFRSNDDWYQPAQPNTWPWMVLLLNNDTFICGGVILSERFIVFPAHCIGGRSRYVNAPSDSWEILAGRTDRQTMVDGEQRIKVINIRIHNDYNNGTENDIAYVELDHRLRYTDIPSVMPGCIANSSYAQRLTTGDQRTMVVGWGDRRVYVASGKVERTLSDFVKPLKDINYCRSRFGNQWTLCADDSNKDDYWDDKGSPLMVEFYKRWFLLGLPSYRVTNCASSSSSTCPPIMVYTDVSKHAAWLQDKMDTMSRPGGPCRHDYTPYRGTSPPVG